MGSIFKSCNTSCLRCSRLCARGLHKLKIMKRTKDFFRPVWPVSAAHFAKFQALLHLFQKENAKINLSSFSAESEIWEKHFFDALQAAEFFSNSPGIRVLDLGTGGGFPLLPLAIIFQESEFVAVESVEKKCHAVERFCRELLLRNVCTVCDRAERLGHGEHFREQFDAVTARAFAKFPALLEMALPFLKISGRLIVFRGPESESADFALIKLWGARLLQKKKCMLPSGEQRTVWVLQKVKPTDKKFPRKVGLPKKRPLQVVDF